MSMQALRGRLGTVDKEVAGTMIRTLSRTHGLLLLGLGASLGLAAAAFADGGKADAGNGIPRSPAPEGARVYFITPSDGEEVRSPVTVRFGLSGMGVSPAGHDKSGTGHHHLVVDGPLPPPNLPIPKSAQYRHFGGGQTQTTLELEPGRHTLQLVLGDHLHIPHDPPVVSERITITVVE